MRRDLMNNTRSHLVALAPRSAAKAALLLIVAAQSVHVLPSAQPPAPQGPDYHAYYQIGPDSLPHDGVPKGEVRGPFVLPSQAYPGTLTDKGYDVNYTWGINTHGQRMGGPILPEMMRWLWRDHPVSTDVNHAVERSFNEKKTAREPLPKEWI